MRAAVYTCFGGPDVVQLRELATPTPGDDDLLIKIYATTVSSADSRVRSRKVPLGFRFLMGFVFGFTHPKRPVLGSEIAGVVEAVGKDVTAFSIGDHVFGFTAVSMGGHAEYACVPQYSAVARKPRHLSFAQAAALSFGGTTALDYLRRANIARGDSVLIIGASGAVGSAAIQLAKHFGARVTGVCSTANVALVGSLGATHVIDYRQADYTQSGHTYDAVFDTVGNTPPTRLQQLLTKKGRLLLAAASLPDMAMIPWLALTSRQRVVAGMANAGAGDLRLLAALADAGYLRPVIGQQFPFEQIAQAHRYVDTGHKVGSAVVTMGALGELTNPLHRFSAPR